MEADNLSDNQSKLEFNKHSACAGEGERIKCVIIGDGGTGKTSLLIVFAEGKFPEDYVPTVFDNYTTVTEINGKKVTFMLWDTAGQEDYDRLRPLSYDCVDVMIMCYDVSSPSTFENIPVRWAPESRHFCPNTPVILVACKTDLRPESKNNRMDITDDSSSSRESYDFDERRLITTSEGEDLAKTIEASAFIECSAKDNTNVAQLFATAVHLSLKQEQNYHACTCCSIS